MSAPIATSLFHLFLARLRGAPHAPALLEGRAVFSYQALDAASRRAAAAFRAAGWGPGQVVGSHTQPAPVALQLATMLGLARIGVAQLLVAPHEAGPEAAAALLRRFGAAGCVMARADAPRIGLPAVVPDLAWLDPDAPVPAPADAPLHGDLPWLIGRTSGTTGEPKAFAVSHAQELARMRQQPEAMLLEPRDRLMNLSGFGFLTGLTSAFRSLASGATLVAAPRGAAGQDTAAVLDAIDRFGVTHLWAVPTHVHALLALSPPDAPRLPRLRSLRVAGSVLSRGVLAAAMRRLSPAIHVLYGCNESGAITLATPGMLARCPETVGMAVPGMELAVLDPAGEPLPAGRPGRVWVRSACVVGGYLDAAGAAPQGRFRDGWFDTGDVGALDAGGLLVLKGRADELLNFDGMLVAPQEIEAALEDHPAVAAVAAFAMPSERHQDLPVVAVVPKAEVTSEALLAHARARLGRRAPVAVLLARELPRNGMGKVLRRELAAQAQRLLAAVPRQPN